MTAEIVAQSPQPRVIPAKGDGITPETARELAIERCADRIERALRQRLTLHERIGLARALGELVGDIEWHRPVSW